MIPINDPTVITDSMLSQLLELGLTDCFMVIPTLGVPAEELYSYFSDLEKADTLKYRFSDTPGITTQEAYDHIITVGNTYGVLDTADGKLVAEFALDTFTGRAAQVHFSMHPGNDFAVNRYLFDAVSDQILMQWKVLGDLSIPYLDTLFGLTPVGNRVACIFVLKSKFEKIGILPHGTNYLGDTVDSLVTAKTRH